MASTKAFGAGCKVPPAAEPPSVGQPSAMMIEYRSAELSDANAIANLHARSWREHYRGSFDDAFLDGDLVGERRQTQFHIDRSRDRADESFEIRVRNHKKERVEVRVVEHLYRWLNWKIDEASDPYEKIDSRTVEFRVQVPADGEKVITYRVHYSW